jgi:serine/threonine-protein kinase
MSLIGKQIGNYVIRAKLGEGGMGAVYMGENPSIGKKVAIKVLLEELASKDDIVERFFNEARVVIAIGHPNIIDVLDMGKQKLDAEGPETVYFIMEFLDGESMQSRLRRTGFTPMETLHVMQQCCSALAASHNKGVVHRDLKPDNIFLCPRGGDPNSVKILDFGIAKLTGDGGMGQTHKTRTGLVIGTPAYMSPEQCEGKGLIDHRSDIYAMGVVMYEMITGRVPFPGEGFGEILVAHLTREPEPPHTLRPDVPPELEAICMHAIQKDKLRRFQTMEEFVEALRNPVQHMQTYAPNPGYEPSNFGATVLMGNNPVSLGGNHITGQRGPLTGQGQRPTTLSGAAGEMQAGGQAKSKTPLVAAVAAVVLLGGGGAAFLATRGGDKPVQQVQANQPPVQPVDENVKITINTDPVGAQVVRADTGSAEEGKTPLTFTVKRGSSFDVQVKLDGFESSTRAITADRDQAVLVPLKKVEVPVAAPPPPPPPPVSADVKPTTSASKKKSGERKSEKGGGGGDDMNLMQPKF